MSSFNNLFNRMETLNEAKTSPYAAAHSSFGGVTKQMRAGGLSSAPLDTIRFIREILYKLDVITYEELKAIKSAKGFSGKKKAMLAVLQSNQEAINANTDEIAQAVESTLDNFIGGMGVNRSREEKYAAQAAAQEMAAEIRKAKSGKEMDDALTDIISDEKLLVKASLAKAIQELEDLPAGEDLSTEIVDNIKKFAPKIDTIEQFEAFVKQMGEMEEYQIPAYHLSGTVKALKGGLEDIEMEDQEDPDEDGEHGSVEEYYPEEKDLRAAGEALNDARLEAEGEAAADERLRETDPAESNEDEYEFFDKIEKEKLREEPNIEDQVHNACMRQAGEERANSDAGMAAACQEMYEIYGEEGDQEKAEIAEDLRKYYAAKIKSEDEELTLESVYDVMGFREIKAPVMDENGKTSQDCSTQQYLTEAAEQEIEEAGLYTEGYLVEQKTTDSYIKSKPAQGQTFKERYKPKTSYQLEELRRYGL